MSGQARVPGADTGTAPLHSYVAELRTRFESLPDLDDALTVPPDASVRPWVAPDIEAALHAAAETVPRSPSSPDSPMLPSPVPAPELSARNVRRPHHDGVEDFPVELKRDAAAMRDVLSDEPMPTLRSRERGRKSGRFVSPSGLRASVDEQGSIAFVVKRLVEAERTASLDVSDVSSLAEPPVEAPPVVAVTGVAVPVATVAGTPDPLPLSEAATVAKGDAEVDAKVEPGARARVALRLLLLFTTATIAGATSVYFALHG